MRKVSTPVLVIIIFGISLVFNLLLIHFESQHPDASITDLSTAYWFLVVTLSTVGYGDYSPVSMGGRVIGYIYVISSLGVLGFLFSTISNKIRAMLEETRLGFKGTKFEQHIVFLGWDHFNQQVADEIVHAGKQIAILTNKKDDVDLIYDQYGKQNVFVLFSDHRHSETYSRLNVGEASVVFVSLDDDSVALKEIINLKSEFQNVSTVVSLNEVQLKQTFEAAGVTYVISRNEIASKLIASFIFEPDVASLNVNLISSVGSMSDYDVQEYGVTTSNPYLGKDGHELFFDLKTTYDVILLGLSKKKNNSWELITNPSKNIKVEIEDYIVVMTNGSGKETLKKVFNTEEGRILKINS